MYSFHTCRQSHFINAFAFAFSNCPLPVEIMLSSIFVPSFKGGMVKQDHKEKYLWLIAYAASVHENDDMGPDTTEVQPTYDAILALEDTLSKRTAGTDLTPILANLLVAIEYVFVQDQRPHEQNVGVSPLSSRVCG